MTATAQEAARTPKAEAAQCTATATAATMTATQQQQQHSPQLRTTTCERDMRSMPDTESLEEALAHVRTDYGSAFSSLTLITTEALAPTLLPPMKSVMDVFACAFDDDAALLTRYHRDRGDVDMKWQPWRRTSDGGVFRGQRVFECTTMIRAMMNKRCPFTEYQRYAFIRVKGTPTFVVHFSSQVSGVMYSDAFRSELLCVFTQAGDDGDSSHTVVTMRAYSHVQFLKSVWIRAKIAATAASEQQEGAKRLYELIVECLLTRTAGATVSGAVNTNAGTSTTVATAAVDLAPSMAADARPATAAAAIDTSAQAMTATPAAMTHTSATPLQQQCATRPCTLHVIITLLSALLVVLLALRVLCGVYALRQFGNHHAIQRANEMNWLFCTMGQRGMQQQQQQWDMLLSLMMQRLLYEMAPLLMTLCFAVLLVFVRIASGSYAMLSFGVGDVVTLLLRMMSRVVVRT